MKIKNPKFIKSVLSWEDAPTPPLPEVAFVGRSNVGKSSLINCLVNIKNFARTSKQPGKTRTINYFSISDSCYFVDLPGYGFARTSKKEQKQWQAAIESYLLNSEQLRMVFVLVDSKVGAKESDLQLIEWLKYHQIPHTIVATKVDKVSRSARDKQLSMLRKQLKLNDNTHIFVFSAKDRTGRNELLGFIGQIIR
ncbi:MAG: YihA family ribosome biogenesis GTP-binding protein [Calditrichaeota bacterium]|nr:MAG: YihA family ribosome biogenesis GTP-binding protein [Calditrichota bacterium]